MTFNNLKTKLLPGAGQLFDLSRIGNNESDFISDSDQHTVTQQAFRTYADQQFLTSTIAGVNSNSVYNTVHKSANSVESDKLPTGISWSSRSGNPTFAGSYKLAANGSADMQLRSNVIGKQNMALSIWFTPTNIAAGSDKYIFQFRDAANQNEFSLLQGATSGTAILRTKVGGTTVNLNAPATLSNNTLTHALISVDSGGNLLISINNSQFTTVGNTQNDSIARAIRIFGDNGASQFAGSIDHIEFVARAFTSAEATALYNAGAGSTIKAFLGNVPFADLTFAYVWKLDEGPEDAIDLSKHTSSYYRTLTELTTFQLRNLKNGHQLSLFLDGTNGIENKVTPLFSPSLGNPWRGNLNFSNGRINRLDLEVINDTTGQEKFMYDIHTQAANTNIQSVWELNEKGGDFVCGVGNAKTADVVSEVFPSGITWQPRVDGGLGGRYKLDNDGTAILYTMLQIPATPDVCIVCLSRVDSLASSRSNILFGDISSENWLSVSMTNTLDRWYTQSRVNGVSQDLFAAYSSLVYGQDAFVIVQASGSTLTMFVNGTKYTRSITPQETSVLRNISFLSNETGLPVDGGMARTELASCFLSDAEASALYNGSIVNIQSLQSVLDASRGVGTYDSLDFAYAWDLNEGPQNKVIGTDGTNEVGSGDLSGFLTYLPHSGTPSLGGNYKLNSAKTGISSKIEDNVQISNGQIFIRAIVHFDDVVDESNAFFALSDSSATNRLNVGQSLEIPNTGKIIIASKENGVENLTRTGTGAVSTSGAYDVICQMRDEGGSRRCQLWINNSLVLNYLVSGNINPTALRTVAFASIAGFSNSFDGQYYFAEYADYWAEASDIAALYAGGEGLKLRDHIGSVAYDALNYKRYWSFEQPPLASSKTFDHVASLDSAILPAGVSRLPATAITGTPAICGPVIYDFAGGSNSSFELFENSLGGSLTFRIIFDYDVADKYLVYAWNTGFPPSGPYQYNLSMGVNSSNKFSISSANAAASTLSLASDASLVAGWNDVVCSVDASGNVSMYINGSPDTASGAINPIDSVNRHWRIGGHSGTTSDFDGQIGLFEVHKGLLTPKQVELLYNKGRGNSLAVALA